MDTNNSNQSNEDIPESVERTVTVDEVIAEKDAGSSQEESTTSSADFQQSPTSEEMKRNRRHGNKGYRPEKKDNEGFGIASFVLGIVSLVFFCTCINIVTAILAIVFGIVQLVECKKKWMAITGIVTASVSIVLFIIAMGVIFSSNTIENSVENPENSIKEFEDYYNKNFSNGDGTYHIKGNDGNSSYDIEFNNNGEEPKVEVKGGNNDTL